MPSRFRAASHERIRWKRDDPTSFGPSPKRNVALVVRSTLSSRPLIHPLDALGEAWDLAAECTTPITALQIASALIPVEDGLNRFFSDTARGPV